MKKILIALCVFMTFAASADAQSKIGYINSQELLSFMPEVKNADSVIAIMADEIKKQYGGYVQEYQTKLDDYNKNVATWSEVKKEATETDLLNMQERISTYQETSQKRIDAKREELLTPVLAKADEAIKAVGKDQKLTCVIDTSVGAVIYVGDDMINILPMVKQKLNLPN